MHKFSTLLFTVFFSVAFTLGGISDAEAKRFGGMKSFGSKSSYNRAYSSKTSKPASRTASQQKAYDQNNTARQTMSKRGGLMGILGGLALGGLLGSLFFGGAFENFNFLDLILFGGVAFLLFKLFAAKQGQQQQAAYQRQGHQKNTPSQPIDIESNYLRNSQQNDADFDTAENTSVNKPYADHAISTPKDFDQEAFINGAKAAYEVLQNAWDNKDLGDIRGLTTDKVFAEIQSQIQAEDGINKTSILSIDVQLLEVREAGSDLEATVLFDTMLREEENERPQQVREVWTFIKQKNSLQPKWYLDGLQQLDD